MVLPPLLEIYISQGWAAAIGCRLCIPISLAVGVGIQLTFSPWQASPPHWFPFSPTRSPATPAVAVIEGFSDPAGALGTIVPRFPLVLTCSRAPGAHVNPGTPRLSCRSKVLCFLCFGFFFPPQVVPLFSQWKPRGSSSVLGLNDNMDLFQAMASAPRGSSHWLHCLVCC